jgi:RND family efflux transporter MFP subunit
MSKMQSEYDVERAKLDASKAEVLSAVEGEKNRIQVQVKEGSLQQVKASINAHQIGNDADLNRQTQNKDKAVRDLATATGYLSMMQLRAPTDGVVIVLSNFRSQGSFGQSLPPFKEGDNAWNGAEIVEIPDIHDLYIDLKLEEVDRGRIQIGQAVRVRVDAIPDKEFDATLDYISPIAQLIFKGGATPEKSFPARASMKNLDERLRPGMSASAEVIIERQPNTLLIPARASFDKDGKPAVYVQIGKQFKVRPIEVGRRNDDDIVVTSGLKEGEIVTLESPAEAAKRAKKKM